jgi:uncharacterized protein
MGIIRGGATTTRRIGPGAMAVLLALAGLAACGAPSSVATGPTPIPTSAPFPTWTPTLDVPSHAVTFTTSDHIKLAGRLYGHGQTVIIFSNQTDTTAGNWQPIAQEFAARGYLTLCYDYRGRGDSQGTRDLGPSMLPDLRAAVAFARRLGARRIVLVGASIGGAVTANVAATAAATTPIAAVAIISAPGDFGPGLGVTAATIASISAPKLLMNSQGDSYASDIQTMYNEARQPKALQFYPGGDHGLDLFTGVYGHQAMARLPALTRQYAPPGS